MAARRSGLGRNLNALLGDSSLLNNASVTTEQDAQPAPTDAQLKKLPIEFLQPGVYQPRRDMDETALQELADSIKAQGIIQPIVTRPVANKRYEIIAGERRWRAAQLAGLSDVPVIIRDIPDETAIAVALIENIQREDLNPIEEARALQRLIDEFTLTHHEVAQAVGKSRTAVTNLLRLMNLVVEVQTLLEHGDLEMGHARALLSLPAQKQAEIARQVIARSYSVRETEHLVRKLLQGGKPSQAATRLSPDIKSFQDSLGEKLGAKVMIQHNASGKGKLVIHYNSVDELDGIVKHID